MLPIFVSSLLNYSIFLRSKTPSAKLPHLHRRHANDGAEAFELEAAAEGSHLHAAALAARVGREGALRLVGDDVLRRDVAPDALGELCDLFRRARLQESPARFRRERDELLLAL